MLFNLHNSMRIISKHVINKKINLNNSTLKVNFERYNVVGYGHLIVLCRFLSIFMKGKFEDTKSVPRSNKSKKNRHRKNEKQNISHCRNNSKIK